MFVGNHRILVRAPIPLSEHALTGWLLSWLDGSLHHLQSILVHMAFNQPVRWEIFSVADNMDMILPLKASLDLLRPMALWTPNPPARSAASEAHRAMAIAMNRIGGKSNTGEGGEEQNVVWMFCLNNLWSPSLLLMPSEPWKKLELFGVYTYSTAIYRRDSYH